MTFPYKHVLVIGATSGIGRAMSDHFIAEGIKVTAVGRRQDRLEEFVSKHGSENASGVPFDISELDKIPGFAQDVMSAHPSIDCIFLNAAVQHAYDFSNPSTIDLGVFNHEMTVNFSSFVALTHALLPHLLSREEKSSLVFTGSPIGLIPAFMLPGYSASKAALDAFIMCLREQLRDTKISTMHISPGPVMTEMHDNVTAQQSVKKFGMSMEEFIEQSYAGLVEGRADIFPGCVGGSTKEQFLEIVKGREEAFERLSKMIRNFH
ncbi:NAD(P)-binding protein [Corynespora cassiicola Philippines]|uniref:NAD(P)-binding protein n=1 Tax=Corynespora cassiicola Philippines TaxID=1448308 RepID=A0A2T2NLE9_CORCC|nr:NAD(P)-binding protein [Corynespora cassiicola Philippines]